MNINHQCTYSLQLKNLCVGILLAENLPNYIYSYNKMIKLPI